MIDKSAGTAETPQISSGRVFISYRRQDSAYPAGWLYDRLVERLGSGQVFKDVDSIELGDDFVQRIAAAVGSCDILLALIGPQWLNIRDSGGSRRIDDSEDFVRLEIEAAVSRNVLLIPILVEGAEMPRRDQLPESISAVSRRQALELSPHRFGADTSQLLDVIQRTLAKLRQGDPVSVTAMVDPLDHLASEEVDPGPGAVGSENHTVGSPLEGSLRKFPLPPSSLQRWLGR